MDILTHRGSGEGSMEGLGGVTCDVSLIFVDCLDLSNILPVVKTGENPAVSSKKESKTNEQEGLINNAFKTISMSQLIFFTGIQ